MNMQAVLRAVYPPQCLTCDALVETEHGLCAACWKDTPFISGLACDKCGTPLPGDPAETGAVCDDCIRTARPWAQGRAAMLYDANARTLVLALKHADRMELARPAGHWLSRAGRSFAEPGALVVPVPLHRWRLWRRSYNQSALLAAAFAAEVGLEHCPDALVRLRRTPSQDHRDRVARFANLQGALAVPANRQGLVAGRRVILVDDVMTSGATLAAGADALLAAGARTVCVLVLARVAKDP